MPLDLPRSMGFGATQPPTRLLLTHKPGAGLTAMRMWCCVKAAKSTQLKCEKGETMKITIDQKNADKIMAALEAVNGRAREHTFCMFLQLSSLAEQAEKELTALVNKSDAAGALYIATSGGEMPNSYKYARAATKVTLERGSKNWFLISVEPAAIYNSGGNEYLILSPSQDAKAVERLRSKYRVTKPNITLAA
jgi:hypothetical protein